jgi:hypothetical protein
MRRLQRLRRLRSTRLRGTRLRRLCGTRLRRLRGTRLRGLRSTRLRRGTRLPGLPRLRSAQLWRLRLRSLRRRLRILRDMDALGLGLVLLTENQPQAGSRSPCRTFADGLSCRAW